MTVQKKEPGSAEDKVPGLIVELLAALHNALDDSEDTGDGNLLTPEDVQALDHLLGKLLTNAPKPDGYVATPAANVRQYFALRAAHQAPHPAEPVAFRWVPMGIFDPPLEWSEWSDVAYLESAKKCHGGDGLVFEFAYTSPQPSPSQAEKE